jgi:hypothetical protein
MVADKVGDVRIVFEDNDVLLHCKFHLLSYNDSNRKAQSAGQQHQPSIVSGRRGLLPSRGEPTEDFPHKNSVCRGHCGLGSNVCGRTGSSCSAASAHNSRHHYAG